jgi:hypothetical protein
MSGVLMKCGHSTTGKRQSDGTPVCVICWPKPESAQVEDSPPDLTGRMADCSYPDGKYGSHAGGRQAPSSTSLPFFQHRPDQPTDLYYCGCWGWD